MSINVQRLTLRAWAARERTPPPFPAPASTALAVAYDPGEEVVGKEEGFGKGKVVLFSGALEGGGWGGIPVGNRCVIPVINPTMR